MTDQINSMVENKKVIALSDGSAFPMPKLTTSKVLKLAKMMTGDFTGIYSKVTSTVKKPVFYPKGMFKLDEKNEKILDETGNPIQYTGNEPVLDADGNQVTAFDSRDIEGIVEVVLEELTEETITKLIGVILGVSEQEAGEMDIFDTVIIISEFLANTNVHKAFLAIQKVTGTFKPKKQPEIKTENTGSNNSVVQFPNTPPN
ncbi:hypothetical protein ACQUEF_01660 [Vagococcus fluvialis]|uniref:hypothetical protein n=1 Tax=Vagococcus fluvialis TaxID=2738 RepID=UPI003B227546